MMRLRQDILNYIAQLIAWKGVLVD